MMNKFKLILILVTFTSCDSNKENLSTVPVLNLKPDSTVQLKMSKFIKDVDFIKLSSKNDQYIGAIDKLIVKNDRIYVLDSYNSIGLYVYDRKGRQLFNITNYGRGPGEFMGPYDFDIDETKDQIVIYDAREMKLSFFDLGDGSFIKDERLGFHFRRFNVIDEGYIFYLDNRKEPHIKHNIIITDKNYNIIHESIKIINNMRGSYYMLPVNFTGFKNNLYFTAHSDNSIYRLKEGDFDRYLTVDFADKNLPPEYYEAYEGNKERRKQIGDAAYNISNYFETSKYVFFLYWINNNTNYYLRSKNTDKTLHTNNEKLIDDVGIGPLNRWPLSYTDSSLIWYNQPNKLINYLNEKEKQLSEKEWEKFKINNEKLISFSNKINKSDNPYLSFMKIEF